MLITNMVRGWKKISKNKNNNKKLTHQQSLTPRTNSFKPEAVMRPKKSPKEPTAANNQREPSGNRKIDKSENVEPAERPACNMMPPLQRDGPAPDGWEELPTTSKAAAATSDAPPSSPTATPLETTGLGAWKRIEKPAPIAEPPILSAKRNRAMRKRTSNWVKMASNPVVEIPLPIVNVVEPCSSKCRPGTLYSDVLLTGGTLNRLTAAAQRGVGDQLELADDNISVGGGALVASNLGFFPSLNALNKKPKAGNQQTGGPISSQAGQREEADEEDGTGQPSVAEADLLHLQMETLSLDSSLSRSGGLTDYEYFSAETDNDGWITSSGEVEMEDSEFDSKSTDERSSSSHCPYEVVGEVAALVAKGYAATIGGGNDVNNNEANIEYANGNKLDLGYADVESHVHADVACYAANVGQVCEVTDADVVYADDVLVNASDANANATFRYELTADENVTSYFSAPNEAPSQHQCIGVENVLEKSSMGARITSHVMLDIHPWNFLHLSDSSFIDFPRLLMQFSDPNYVRLEHQSLLGIKLAMGNMGGGGMPKH